MFEILAQASTSQVQPGDPSPVERLVRGPLPLFAVLGVMLYFLLIRPQSQQRKQQENLLKSLKSGDKILLSNGIFGIITNVKEKSLMVKIADNVKIEVLKSAVSTVIEKSGESDTSST